jgi:hypothetical protein
MNEHDDLERQLDAAFASTRPRRGFEDELWARLQTGRPWWRRRPSLGWVVSWPALSAATTVLVVGLAAFGLSHLPRMHMGAASMPSSAGAPGADSRYGALPRPPETPGAALSAGTAAPRAGSADLTTPGAYYVPPDPIHLRVYRYAAGAGPSPGTVIELDQVPPGLDSATYATRSPVEAVREASAERMGVTGVRIVYVAVADGGTVYLEPVYLLTGTVGAEGSKTEKQVLVPALTSSSIR